MAIKIGNSPLAKVMFGTREVTKICFGSSVVYEKSAPGPVVDPILANNSWETIRAVCEAGTAANYWALGDTKTDTGTDNVTRTFRICDMSGLYGKHVVFEQVELTNDRYVWNASSNVDEDNCYNNYNISQMRSTHLPALLAKYSSDLQGQLTNTTYKVAKNGTSTTLLDLTDKLFLPAERELFASRSYSRAEEWNALTRFALYALPANDNNTFRIKYDPSNTARAYWERSPYSGNSSYVFSALPIIERTGFPVLLHNLFNEVAFLIHEFAPMKEGIIPVFGNVPVITADSDRGNEYLQSVDITQGK